MSGGFAAILARLRGPQLRLHCDEALRGELLQTQLALQDVRGALQRVRDVGRAASQLGSGDAVAALGTLAALCEMEKLQREMARAVAAFGSAAVTPAMVSSGDATSSAFVCSKCGGGRPPPQLVGTKDEPPLLAKPDTAALSPPRRRKPSVRKKIKPTPEPRRKLVVPRRHSPEPVAEQETTTTSASMATHHEHDEDEDDEKHKDEIKSESSDGVVIVEDESETDEDEDADDVRVRLQRKIDACWPLATQLGALEMPQRRRADYADLSTRVVALFRTLLKCDVELMASRSMRSVLVKARDSLAVAVSLMSLHEVNDENAPVILALVKAVDAASEKHATLQKQIAPFRNSLADFEVALLTRSYDQLSSQPTKHEPKATPRKKLRRGR